MGTYGLQAEIASLWAAFLRLAKPYEHLTESMAVMMAPPDAKDEMDAVAERALELEAALAKYQVATLRAKYGVAV